MADIKPTTIAQYLATLPPERKKLIQAVRKTIKANLDPKLREGIQYGMIGYFVPHSVYPPGYHCDPKQPLPFAGIGNQKNHVGFYFFCVYQSEDVKNWFVDAWKKTGTKLDMGKACIRVKTLDDVPLGVVGELVRRVTADEFIETYEGHFGGTHPGKKAAAKKTAGRTTKTTAKKATKKTSKSASKRTSKKTAKTSRKKAPARRSRG
ncbi:MAG: DUF1801 domain-containing protein [Planctomycetota bacterium]